MNQILNPIGGQNLVPNFPTCQIELPDLWLRQLPQFHPLLVAISKGDLQNQSLTCNQLAGGTSGVGIHECRLDQSYYIIKFGTENHCTQRTVREIEAYKRAMESPFSNRLVKIISCDNKSGVIVMERASGQSYSDILLDQSIPDEKKLQIFDQLVGVESDAVFDSNSMVSRFDETNSTYQSPDSLGEVKEISMLFAEEEDTYSRLRKNCDTIITYQDHKLSLNDLLQLPLTEHGINLDQMYNFSLQFLHQNPSQNIFLMFGDTTKDNVFFDLNNNDQLTLIDPEWVGYQDPAVALVRTLKIDGIKTQNLDPELRRKLQEKADHFLIEFAQSFEKEHDQDKHLTIAKHYFARVCSRFRSIMLRLDKANTIEVELPLLVSDFKKATQQMRLSELKKIDQIPSPKTLNSGYQLYDYFIKFFDSEIDSPQGINSLIEKLEDTFDLCIDPEKTFLDLLERLSGKREQFLYDKDGVKNLQRFGELKIWTQATTITEQRQKIHLSGYTELDCQCYTANASQIPDLVLGSGLEVKFGNKIDGFINELISTDPTKTVIVIDDRINNLQEIQSKHEGYNLQNNLILIQLDHDGCHLPNQGGSILSFASFEQVCNYLESIPADQGNIYVDFDSTIFNSKLYKETLINNIYDLFYNN